MERTTNFAQLEAAGLVVPDHKFTDAELRAIESLTEEEVRAIISSARKLSYGGAKERKGAIEGIIL